MKKYIVYYRVSTRKQGESGLGLEGQKTIIQHFIPAESIVQEFTEVASAKEIANRPLIQEAVKLCIENGYTLVVAKLDRLSRKTEDALAVYSQLEGRLESCDVPNLDKFSLTLFMAIADRERELISIRTKAAMDEKKKKVGEWRKQGKGFKDEKRKKQAIRTRQENAAKKENNRRAACLIAELRTRNVAWNAIAQRLNEAGFQTSKGKQFQAVQVQRVYEKYAC